MGNYILLQESSAKLGSGYQCLFVVLLFQNTPFLFQNSYFNLLSLVLLIKQLWEPNNRFDTQTHTNMSEDGPEMAVNQSGSSHSILCALILACRFAFSRGVNRHERILITSPITGREGTKRRFSSAPSPFRLAGLARIFVRIHFKLNF